MIIDCIGCMHGEFTKLDGGDLLIVTGDLTASDKEHQYLTFFDWLFGQNYQMKIVIAGNHDNEMENRYVNFSQHSDCRYLCDSGTEFEIEQEIEEEHKFKGFIKYTQKKKLKIWGSPWTSRFLGINKHCCAFTESDDTQLVKHFDKIPNDIDILITHGPPLHILDTNKNGYACGSRSLRDALDRVKPRLHIFSHIHEQGGNQIMYQDSQTWCVNCSLMNGDYEAINKPVRIKL